ncbi:unnamed protein product [Acanthoscelides obtectus]|uniref:Complex 1 LYR protein domain-containing protein n=1 Tax=Acanthoscelides obtectus TaxID=200917 RepID=A0A9P0LQC8_ACAOB|nr:unnamed protein product [Acanthoscelides obtectus]CAK1637651.1 MIEF1 upstream open reading frame protein [Acanthoscelides obtectus]
MITCKMSSPSRLQILTLYKELLRYGQQLKFTDKAYFKRRIKDEFYSNRKLSEPEEITIQFEKGVNLLVKHAVK